MKKGLLVLLVMSLAMGTLFAGGAKEAKYPTKPISIVCPWAAGGGTDRIARYFADALAKEVGQPVNVVNKTGGSGAVGHLEGANAAPDGGEPIDAIIKRRCAPCHNAPQPEWPFLPRNPY